MEFQTTIKQQRLAKGLKSVELAQRLGVSPARVSMLERDEARGAVTLKMLQRAAEALGCRLEYRLTPVNPASESVAESPAEKPRIKLTADELS